MHKNSNKNGSVQNNDEQGNSQNNNSKGLKACSNCDASNHNVR